MCPWNKFAAQAQEHGYWARIELTCPKLAHLSALDDRTFREVFSGSPIKRIGRDRFVRNVLYAIGNSREEGLIPYAQARMEDADPTVAEAASWAVSQLMTETT